MNIRKLCGAVGAAVMMAGSMSATPLAALDTGVSDARWSAWLGCWRPEAVEGAVPPSHVICVLPGSGAGVSIATVADGRIVSEQMIVADGTRRSVNDGGCTGYETAAWSQDGRRVFLQSDLSCGGDVQRRSSGVLALVSTASYVDIQTVDVSGEKASRTVRYIALREDEMPGVARDRLTSEPLARESARIRASAPLDFEDIVEATRIAGAPAAEGLLVARRAGFALNADRLRSLSAAGVEPSTIDVMVALTYPDHFVVEEELPRVSQDRTLWGGGPERSEPWGTSTRSSCISSMDVRYDAYSYDRYGSRYSRCGYNSFYSPYGYDSYGWGYGSGPVVVVSPGEKTDEVQGVAVKGKGYTRRGTTDGTTGTARPRAEPATRSEGTVSKGGSTGSAQGSGSTGGSSGGSSSGGTSTGRTAKPKGGGI